MKIQNVIMLVLLSGFVTISQAQTVHQRKGDKHYSRFSYSKAISFYEKIKEKSIEVKRNLAFSYYSLGNYKKSENWRKEVVGTEGYTAEDAYNYSYILRMNKQYDLSEYWTSIYNKKKGSEKEEPLEDINKGKYKILQKDVNRYEIKNLSMNTSSQEFAPNYYDKHIVFTSSRKGGDFRLWKGNNKPYLNLYKGEIEEDLELSKIKQFYPKENKKWHEGPVSFSDSGTYMAFTRNNYEKTSAGGVRKLMLYTSEKKDGKWTKPKEFAYNSSEYSIGHASLSPDGKTMYFISDMPGGYGSTDIYKSTRDGDVWSKPINLGPNVNTERREMFPFIDYEGKALFYASDGHYGLGGLDIFRSKLKKEGESYYYGKPLNLGFPVNTNYDDFALVIDKEYKTGYFSSNRTEGHGDDDIYSFKLLKPFSKTLRGFVLDVETESTLAGAKVQLYDASGKLIDEQITGKDGVYEIFVEEGAGSVYGLKASKEGYKEDDISVNIGTDLDVIEKNFNLTKLPNVVLKVSVKDEETGLLLSNVKSIFTPCLSKETEPAYYTNSEGVFIKEMNKSLNDEICFEVNYSKAGYYEKTMSYNFVIDYLGEYNIEETLSSKELEKSTGIVEDYSDMRWFENADSYTLTTEGKSALDDIVRRLTANPDMQMDIAVHTDCRGTQKKSQLLSNNRVKEILNYIKSRISNPSRITGKGYGATYRIIDCGCNLRIEDDCYKQNNRIEFKVTK